MWNSRGKWGCFVWAPRLTWLTARRERLRTWSSQWHVNTKMSPTCPLCLPEPPEVTPASEGSNLPGRSVQDSLLTLPTVQFWTRAVLKLMPSNDLALWSWWKWHSEASRCGIGNQQCTWLLIKWFGGDITWSQQTWCLINSARMSRRMV
jgi:hypothetical protein